MGFVVDIRSSSFFLAKKRRPAALRALQALALERPRELHDPEAVLAATELLPALEANHWRATVDVEDNLTSLEYTADKLPHDASDDAPEAFLGALSRHVDHGTIRFTSEGDPGYETRFSLGKSIRRSRMQRDRYRFDTLDARPRCAPGEEVTRTIELVHQWGDEAQVVPRVRNPELDVIGILDESPMRAGERRTLTLRAGPDALGFAYTIVDGLFAGRDEPAACDTVSVDVVPTEHSPLDVALVEPHFQRSRKLLLAAKDVPRALVELKAHAAREKGTPGGAFLRAIEEATDFTSALASAGLITKMAGDVVLSIQPREGKQPCSEWHLLHLLHAFAHRTLASSGGGFRFAKRGRPLRWIDYSFSAGLRRTIHPRVGD